MDYSGMSSESNEYFYSANPSPAAGHENGESGHFSVDGFKSSEYFYSAHPSPRAAAHGLYDKGECGNFSVGDFTSTLDNVGSITQTNQENGRTNTSTTCSSTALSVSFQARSRLHQAGLTRLYSEDGLRIDYRNEHSVYVRSRGIKTWRSSWRRQSGKSNYSTIDTDYC
jgi:hypothetical protein